MVVLKMLECHKCKSITNLREVNNQGIVKIFCEDCFYKDYPKNLDTILDLMKDELSTNDIEQSHSNADNLIVEALKYVSKFSQHEEKVKKIINMYNEVEKWYA